MLTAQAVKDHLPILRRYARALTGSQESGDNYVAAALEALTEQPTLIDEKTSVRVGMFRVFSKIWNSLEVNAGKDPIDARPADRHLGQIGAMPRQAFLLVSLEGFSEEDAARILDISSSKVRELIDECGKELASQIATNILIIEDEALIAMDLQSLVENLGHEVQGIARTRAEAVAIAKNKDLGLILADIQLADGSSGLDAVNDLLNTFEVPVIFITAYPERFLTGMRPEPAFLITKPYQPAMVSAVISQALFFERKAHKTKNRAVGYSPEREASVPKPSRAIAEQQFRELGCKATPASWSCRCCSGRKSALNGSVDGLHPGIDLPLRFVFGVAVTLLKPAGELGLVALDDVQIVVGQFPPLLLNLAFELLPVSFDSIPIHDILLRWR